MTDNQKMQVQASPRASMDSRDDGYVHIEIEDVISGVVVVAVDIPAGRFVRLMSGSIQTHEGFIAPDYQLARIGKVANNFQVRVPREEAEASKRGRDDAERWLLANRPDEVPEDAPKLDVSQHNYGWAGVWRWWTDPE